MKRKWFVMIVACFLLIKASSQTLFTYGKYPVSVSEFLHAYNKNNTAPVADKAKAIRAYLNLYIASRLKIREAYERRYDTLPQQKEELSNLRMQILENYMNDPESFNKLLNEAFQRTQKDIHIAHIFISFLNASGQADSTAAKQKAGDAYQRLKKGEDFSKIAKQYSNDPAVIQNNGDVGYITVFTLPYAFENIVYSLPVNNISVPYKSKAGYHIFKKLGERNAVGKLTAAQILLAIPPGSDEATISQITLRADSLYNRLLKGDDFSKLASQYSNDISSSATGGIMPVFGIGQYEPAFENVILALKNGEISKPFRTSHGYHIVKRISVVPIQADRNNKRFMDDIRQKVEQSDRMKTAADVLYAKVIQKTPVEKFPYRNAELWVLTDSILDNKPVSIILKMNRQSPLFKLGGKTFKVSDWINYAQNYRYKQNGTGVKPYEQVMEEFIHSVALQYYRDHLELFNEEFRNQVNEFRDGNLFFEIMQREIWGRMQTDTAALIAYFEKHKNNYSWKQSADVVIFFCSDETTSRILYGLVKQNPAGWRSIADGLGEKVVADSGRHEWSQIPNGNKAALKPGMITAPVLNKTDNSASFAYVLALYPNPAIRSFDEAKGLVINDYQVELEDKWVEALKKKYPVKVNEKVLQTILK